MATERDREELLRKMREERARLLDVVRALPEEQLRSAPLDATGEAEWTPLEQLAHLAEMDRTYRAWVRAALEEENPDLSRVPWQRVPIPVEEANEHSLDVLLAQLEGERRETVAFIESLPLEAFERTATSPMFGTLTVLQWLRSYYRHDRQHRAQILGEESDYRPRFLSGQEPDQRRRR